MQSGRIKNREVVMSGWNYEAGMSNNAANAYESGLIPASRIGRVPADLIREFCSPAEWHHSSSYKKRVDFYSRHEVLVTFGLEGHGPDCASIGCETRVNPDAVNALKNYRRDKKAEEVKIYKNASVSWLEWSGSRAHSKCTHREEIARTISVRGCTATITLRSGDIFQKRLSTKGFWFSTVPVTRKELLTDTAKRKKDYAAWKSQK